MQKEWKKPSDVPLARYHWVDIESEGSSYPSRLTAANCYMEMFSGCTNLHSAPDLPATVLEDKCYLRMF